MKETGENLFVCHKFKRHLLD